MVVAVPRRDVASAVDLLRSSGHGAVEVGEITAGSGRVELVPETPA
jgi:phosphoribosylaminoimidazole (AIR) synthetase